MATEVGKGFVEVVADLDKFGASISKGMSGQQAAFAKSGTDAGKSFGTGVEKELGGKQSIFSKFGAQQGAAFSGALSGALVAGTVGAGVAIGGFAIKAIDDFQKTAIAADRFRDTTGLALDESSRWIAVADDVGIGAQTIEGAFKRMQTAIDKNRTAFGDLIVTTASGATDLTATFLNVVEHLQGIEDPIVRANEATKLFGRGFGEISQLITTDADTLRQSLEDVSDAQIIDEDEVTKARDYEAAIDGLSDAFRDFSIGAGETLIPVATALAKIATEASKVNDVVSGKGGGLFGALTGFKIDFMAESWGDFITKVDDTKEAVSSAAETAETAKGVFTGMATAGMSAAESQRRLNESFGGFEGRAAGIGQAMDDYAASTKAAEEASRGLLNAQLALFDSTFAVAESQRAFNDAALEANTTTDNQTVAFEDAAQAALRVADNTVKYAEDQATLQGSTLSAEDATKIQIDTLSALAAQIGGPVADTIMGMVGQLQTLDKTNADPDATLNDQATGPIGAVRDHVRNLDGSTATVFARANTDAANRALDALGTRLSRVNGMLVGLGSIPGFQHGGMIPGSPNQAVPIIAHGGEYVLSADIVDRIKQGAPSRGAIQGAIVAAGGVGSRQAITIINQGTFLGTEEAFGKLADRAIAQARRAGNRAA